MGRHVLMLVPVEELVGASVEVSAGSDEEAAAWLMGAGGDMLDGLAYELSVALLARDRGGGPEVYASRLVGGGGPAANTGEHIANTGGSERTQSEPHGLTCADAGEGANDG